MVTQSAKIVNTALYIYIRQNILENVTTRTGSEHGCADHQNSRIMLEIRRKRFYS